MEIIQLAPTDSFCRTVVYSIMNSSHDRRIRGETLDFYRNGRIKFLKKNGVIIWLVGIDDESNKIGISGCAFGCKSKQVIHSITTVLPEFRKMGYGKKLLNAKMEILRKQYPKAKYRSFVNINNEPSIKMCSAVGLIISGEGTRKRPGKEPTKFYTFEDM